MLYHGAHTKELASGVNALPLALKGAKAMWVPPAENIQHIKGAHRQGRQG